MINVTQDFKKTISKTSRTFIAKLLYQDTEIDCGIRALKIYKGACSNNAFLPGTVYSSYVDATIDITDHTLENKEIQLKIGLVLEDGSVEYVKMGYYTVTSPKSTAYQTSFTAVGRINSKLNRIFEAPEACSISNIANSITRTTGVNILFKGVEPAGTIEKSMVGMTCKEALGVITSVLGAFATEDNEGNVVVCKFNSEETYRVDGDRMTSLPEFNDFDYNLYGVKVIVSEAGQAEDGTTIEEVSFSSGEPRMVLNNAYMTESLFNNFCNNIVGYTFRPGKVLLALGDPRIEPWDCMSVEDIKGNVFNVPCLNIVHTYDGGFNTEISAPGESETETSSATKGPIVQQLERISAALLTVNSAILKRLKADEAELMYAKIESLNVINAEIEKLKTSIITTDYLEANYATIESLEATNATIENITVAIANMADLIADKATIKQLEALDAYIKNLEADMLTVTKADLKYASIESLNTEKGRIDELDSKKVNVDKANIDTAWIVDLLVKGKFLADSIEAATGSFSKYLTGVNIVGDNITAGTIKTDRLIIRDADSDTGILFALNNGIVEQTELSSEELKRLALDGSILVAQSVTADKINVYDLFAQNILSTGNFNMGGKGALVYDSENDQLSIRAKDITLETGSLVQTDELNETATRLEGVISQNKDDLTAAINESEKGIKEDAQATYATKDELTATKSKLEILSNQVGISVETIEKIISTFEFTELGLIIGKSDSEIKSVQDNDSYEFIDKAGNVILAINTKGINTPTANVEKQITMYGQWAQRRGAYVNGVGYNLNDIWIGG